MKVILINLVLYECYNTKTAGFSLTARVEAEQPFHIPNVFIKDTTGITNKNGLAESTC